MASLNRFDAPTAKPNRYGNVSAATRRALEQGDMASLNRFDAPSAKQTAIRNRYSNVSAATRQALERGDMASLNQYDQHPAAMSQPGGARNLIETYLAGMKRYQALDSEQQALETQLKAANNAARGGTLPGQKLDYGKLSALQKQKQRVRDALPDLWEEIKKMSPEEKQEFARILHDDYGYRSFLESLGYSSERMLAALLGTVENTAKAVGGGANWLLGKLTGGFGLAENKVSQFFDQAAENTFGLDLTGAYEKNIDERYKPNEMQKKLTGIGQIGVSMLPSIALTTITGGALSPAALSGVNYGPVATAMMQNSGLVMMSSSAAGRAATEVYQQTGDVDAAIAYGTLSGLTELVTERMFDGIPNLLPKGQKGFVDEAIEKVSKKLFSNPQVRDAVGKLSKSALLKSVKDIFGEGLEEVVSEAVDPILRRITFEPDAPWASKEQLLESFIGGAIGSILIKAGFGLGEKADAAIDRIRGQGGGADWTQSALSGVDADLLEDISLDEEGNLILPVERNGRTMQAMFDAQGNLKEVSIPENRTGIVSYTPEEINRLNSGKNEFITTPDAVASFIERALTHADSDFKRLYFGKVDSLLAQQIQRETGLDVEHYNLVLSNDKVRKIIKSHGNPETEFARGQLPITKDLMERIPEVVAHPDKIYLSGSTEQGKPVIKFEKWIDGYAVVVENVSDKHHNLETQTFYIINKKKPATALDAMPQAGTSETISGTASLKVGTPSTYGDNGNPPPAKMGPSSNLSVAQQGQKGNLPPAIDPITGEEILPVARPGGAAVEERILQDLDPYAALTNRTGYRTMEENTPVRQGGVEDGQGRLDLRAVPDEGGLRERPSTVGTGKGTQNIGTGSAFSSRDGTESQNTGNQAETSAKPGGIQKTDGAAAQTDSGKEITRQIGRLSATYTIPEPSRVSPNAKGLQDKLAEIGIEGAVGLDGMWTTGSEPGKQYFVHGARAMPTGDAVLINNEIDQPPEASFPHECLHLCHILEPQVFEPLRQAMDDSGITIITDDGSLHPTLKLIEKAYGENFPGLLAIENQSQLFEELIAQAFGYDQTDPQFAREWFGDLIDDYDLVMQQAQMAYDQFIAKRKQNSSFTGRGGNVTTDEGTSPFGPNTVGSAEHNPHSYAGMQTEYGVIEPGEAPRAREVDVPKRTAKHNRTMRFARTVMEVPATTDELASEMEREIVNHTFSHIPISDKSAMEYAKRQIAGKGFAKALAEWQGAADSDQVLSKNNIAIGEQLLVEAADAGDVQTAVRIAADLAAAGVRAGQTVQAMRLLKKMSPEGQLYYVQKVVNHLQQDLDHRFKAKAPQLTIDEALTKALLAAKTTDGMEQAVMDIYADLGKQVPATWMDKWNAWRYLSMLGNPRTHIRNVLGNAVFVPAVQLKNLIKYSLQGGADAVLRMAGKEGLKEHTTAILTPADKALKDFAREDFESIRDVITSGGKANPANLIRDNQQVFNTKWLEGLRKGNSRLLEWEDGLFLKSHYTNALAQYLKANQATEDFIRSGTKQANTMLEKARTYAINEAQKATYRDASRVAKGLNTIKKVPVLGVLTEGLLPFTKTPANILKRGVEYSPIGLLKSLTYDLAKMKQGEKTAAQVIDSVAAGLTGSGILMLGAWLASMGLISGGKEDDDRKSAFDKLVGRQNYAINLDGHNYTIDWMAPLSLPFFVGVESFRAFKQEDDDYTLEDFIDGLARISEPMINMSMLDGLQSTLDAVKYSKGQPLADMGLNIFSNYLGQGVPTLSGQIARTIDPVRRNSYFRERDNGIPDIFEGPIKRNMAKIPGLSMLLDPYVDQWGREDRNDSLSIRMLENFLSPGYYSQENRTKVDEILEDLYELTGESKALPDYASKSYTLNGRTKYFTAEEYTAYQKERGQTAYDILDDLLFDLDYKRMDKEEKVNVVGDVYRLSNALAQYEVVDKPLSDTAQKAYDAYKNAGVDYADYLLFRSKLVQGYSQEAYRKALDSMTFTNRQKAYLYRQRYPKSENPYG